MDAMVYKQYITEWQSKKVVVVGDIMLDEYLIGTVSRISPEAPVPVVHIREHSVHLGGAANVAKNITALGGNAVLIGVCGNDTHGAVLRELLEKEGIEQHIFPLAGIPTIVKTRVVAGAQHIVRVDKEEVQAVPAESIKAILQCIEDVCIDVDVLVLSDYAKGMISEDFLYALEELWKRIGRKPKIIVDPKVVNMPLFTDVFMLTPNAKETEESSGCAIGSEAGLENAGATLLERLRATYLLTTLGSEGMALFTAGRKVLHIPTEAQTVYDVTGAGDTVVATIAFALANGNSVEDAVRIANYSAGYSVSQLGVVAVHRENIIEMIERVYSA